MTPVIEARKITKTFTTRPVLRDFSLRIRPGEVHGLLGENGSGKSTFIKILSGYHQPDPGAELKLRGSRVKLPILPGRAAGLGIGFVHQDLALFEEGTVLENVRVGQFQTGFGWRIPWRTERRSVADAMRKYGLEVDPRSPIADLGPVDRTVLAIVRALECVRGEGSGALLVLDEPTAYLPRDDVERLFASIREVASQGLGILFVSHRIEEVLAITDRVTILRDGVQVHTGATHTLTEHELVELILGTELQGLYPEARHSEEPVELDVVKAEGAVLEGFAVQARRGEIVGLTGLAGMGFEEVPYLLFGAADKAAGTMTLGGRSVDLARFSPSAALDAGLALLPANRSRDGGVLAATALENVTLPTLRRYFNGALLSHRRERADVNRLFDAFDVTPLTPSAPLGTFSGGNQQKILLAKWLNVEPSILLLHEPTHGVDIGAKREIFRKIREAADSGTTLVIASVEYEDLANICDRVLVFRSGRVVAELHGDSLTASTVAETALRQDPRRGSVHPGKPPEGSP